MSGLGTALFYGLMFAILLGTVAMTFNQGIWTNTLTLINTVVSGLVSFGYFVPVTEWLKEQVGDEYRFVLPLVVLWILFCVTFIVLQRGICAPLSKTNMRFIPQFEQAGSWVLALVLAVVVLSFTFATLHLAPLPVAMIAGKLDYKFSEASSQQPDVFWLRLAETALDPERWGGSKFDAAGYVDTFRNVRADLETKQGLLSR